MRNSEELERENQALRDRLSGLSQASLRCIVPRAGQHVLLPPAPRGLGMDVETPVYLSPRQVGFLLEPHEALRELVGDLVGYSAVVYALSRHGIACPSAGRLQPPSTAMSGQEGVRSPIARGQSFPEPPHLLPCLRTFFDALYRPGPLTVGANSSVNLLLSLVRTAP